MSTRKIAVTPRTLAVMLGISIKKATKIAINADALFRLTPQGKMWVSVIAIKEVMGEALEELEPEESSLVTLPTLCELLDYGSETAKIIALQAGAERLSGYNPRYATNDITSYVRRLASSYSRTQKLRER